MKRFIPFLFILVTGFCGKAQISSSRLDTNAINRLIGTEKRAYEAGTAGSSREHQVAASENFDIHFYRCEWYLDPAIRFISGKITSYFTITQATDNITFDLSDTLSVDSVLYKGSVISFQRPGNDGLLLKFPVSLNNGQKDSVSVFYHGVPRKKSSYRPFEQTIHNGIPELWTLSEPYGGKEWWPCKNGLNDKADSLDLIITTPIQYRSSTNGILFAEDSTANTRRLYFKHRYPIATYLLGIVATNYVVIKDSMLIGGKSMPLNFTTYPERTAESVENSDNTKKSFLVYNQLFGNYPFAAEQYGQTIWGGGGGMEHQTNSFIGGSDFNTVSHELAHQWFGDKITCGSWQDVWLNEGFATYCTALIYDNTDRNIFYLDRQYFLNNIVSLPDGSVWVEDTTNASRIFNGRLTYAKGSYILHMLRWKLGDDIFFRGVRRYLNDPLLKYSFAKTADFKRNLQEESGQDLTSFFQKWLYGQGYPIYNVEWTQDNSNNLFVKINQTTSHPSVSFYDMPVPIQFKNATRDTIIVFDHQKNGQAFIINPGFKADTVIFDPHFWLVERNTVKYTGCSNIKDSTLPNYTIQWFQNSNNWCNVEINQLNKLASTQTENIPLYLHFSGDGKDTAVEIKNIRYTANLWVNTGFRVTNAFISTSCLLNMSYKLSNQTNSTGTNDIKLFPVPVTGNLVSVSLKNPTDKQLSVLLYNAAGQLIHQTKISTPGKDELFTIPLHNAPRGIYMVRMESESAIKTTRRIIRQ